MYSRMTNLQYLLDMYLMILLCTVYGQYTAFAFLYVKINVNYNSFTCFKETSKMKYTSTVFKCTANP